MTKLSVSVVIPTHNRADLVTHAIDSVLRQSFPALEIIVVDDASTDDTATRVDSYGPPVRLLSMASNVERGAARNRGAAVATGNVLAFLDADDEWTADKVEQQLSALSRGHACVTGAAVVTARGALLSEMIPPADVGTRLWRENPHTAAGSSIALPRDLFLRTGGFQEARRLQGAEDWVFLAQILIAGGTIEAVREPLVRYRMHDSNSTGSPDNVARSMWAAVSWFDETGFTSGRTARRQRAVVASVIARQYAAQARWRPAARWSLAACRSGAVADATVGSAMTLASGVKHALVRARDDRRA
jgi:glycosyltransferase involved in cell wall biosynthesis